MDAKLLEMLEQIAKAIAAQFGSNCEVVIHELSGKSAYSSIVAIENGHVTGRKVGDGGLRFKMMLVTSSLTPGTEENSCSTPAIRMVLMA